LTRGKGERVREPTKKEEGRKKIRSWQVHAWKENWPFQKRGRRWSTKSSESRKQEGEGSTLSIPGELGKKRRTFYARRRRKKTTIRNSIREQREKKKGRSQVTIEKGALPLIRGDWANRGNIPLTFFRDEKEIRSPNRRGKVPATR